MNLLSGMEKFGFSVDGELDILADEKPKKEAAATQKAAPVVKQEKDFIILRLNILRFIYQKKKLLNMLKNRKIEQLA